MLETLIQQACELPAQVESLIRELAETRQRMHDILDAQRRIEARVAGEVAAEVGEDGRRRYANEEARKAEIARRLKEDATYQELEQALREAREQVVDAEARLDRARYEHRTATSLLWLLGSAVWAQREDLEKMILDNHRREAARKFAQGAKQLRKHQDDGEDGLLWEQVTVLEARPTKNGTVRAWCLTEDGDKTAVYAKGETGDRLLKAIRGKVVIGYKVLDAGWFAVKAS